VAGDPNIEEPAFWRVRPGGRPPRFNYERNWVRRLEGGWDGKGYTAHLVEVAEEGIDALIAATNARPPEPMPVPPPVLLPSSAAETPTKPPKHETPKECFARLRKKHPQRQKERPSDYADRLVPLMRDALGARAWTRETIRKRLYDK
jgi:hypothetical protein